MAALSVSVATHPNRGRSPWRERPHKKNIVLVNGHSQRPRLGKHHTSRSWASNLSASSQADWNCSQFHFLSVFGLKYFFCPVLGWIHQQQIPLMPNAELEGCNGIKRTDCGELMGLQAAMVRCYHHVTARWKTWKVRTRACLKWPEPWSQPRKSVGLTPHPDSCRQP